MRNIEPPDNSAQEYRIEAIEEGLWNDSGPISRVVRTLCDNAPSRRVEFLLVELIHEWAVDQDEADTADGGY